MKTSTRWMLGATAVAGAAVLAWAFAPRPVPVETAMVEAGRFEQGIEEDGRTRVRDTYVVSAPVAGRLARITLREGDAVGAGQVVAWLWPVMPAMQDVRSLAEAQARLRAAEAAVAVARARQERSRVTLTQTRTQLTRSEQLAREGFLAAAGLDQDRLAVDAAQRELEAAASQLEVAQQERAQAAAALQPAVEAAASRPGANQSAGKKAGSETASGGQAVAATPPSAGTPLALRAPVSGVVLKVPQPSEATVAAGAPVMALGDPRRMEVLAQLLTTDAVRARPGTAAVIEGWGGPPVAATVRRVEPAAFTKVSALGVEEQRVNVLLDVDQVPEAWQRMGDGFKVVVRVITASADGVMLVPVGALFPRPEGGMSAYRVDGGRARLQAVEVSGRNARVGWVSSGLSAGQRVVVYPPAAVVDGVRITERKP